MTTPVAWLVAERRDGQILLGDEWTQRCDTEAEASALADQWRRLDSRYDLVVLAVVEQGAPAGRVTTEVDESTVDLLVDTGLRLQTLARELDAASFAIDEYPTRALTSLAASMFGAAYRAAMSLPGDRATVALNNLDRARPLLAGG